MIEVMEMLNDLKFFGIKNSFEYRLGEASKGNLSYQELICLLLEDEKLYRQNQRSERLRKRAKFRDRVYLEDFEVSTKRGITKSMLTQFKSLGFEQNAENLLFIGGTGAGKSFLAQAIGHEACMGGVEVFFISVNRLFKELAEAQDTYLNYLNRLSSKVKILILDDFGLRNYSHAEANIFYEILEDRYRKGSTIVTSQVRPQGWLSLFEDQVIAEAIVDRLTACAQIVEVKGASFRQKQGKKLGVEKR